MARSEASENERTPWLQTWGGHRAKGGSLVDVHLDLTHVRVRARGELLAEHPRQFARGMTITDPDDEDLGNSSDPLTEIPQLSAEVVCC